MPYLNQVTLMGHVTKTPEVKTVGAKGTSLSKFTIALGDKVKKGDSYVEETSFIDCTVWGIHAEWSKDWPKGQLVLVTGKLKQEKWAASDGTQRTKIVVVATEAIRVTKGEGASKSAPVDYSADTDEYEADGDVPF